MSDEPRPATGGPSAPPPSRGERAAGESRAPLPAQPASSLALPSVEGATGLALLSPASTGAPEPELGARHQVASRGRALAVGAGLAVAGLVAMVFASTTDLLLLAAQVVVFLAGLAAFFAGLSRVGKALRGPAFDLTFWFCVAWVVVVVSLALLAPVLPLAEHANVSTTLDNPVYARPSLLSEHPLGTNNFGLDLLARVIYGARTSLVVGLLAVVIGLVVGGAIGILAGYFRKGLDSVVGVLTNTLLAVPSLVLLIALATVLDPSIRNLAFSLSLLAIPSMIRLARANTMAFAQREFVLAAKAMGATRLRVMTRELLPNVALPMLSMAMVMISMLIVAEASLSFLGLGVQQPNPTWGNMIAEGEGNVLEQHPHVVLVPGVVLFVTVFAFNLIGERARGRWDTRSTNL